MSTIVVLAGGFSHEREVSLRSGRRVAEALRDAGHVVVETDVSSDLVHALSGLDDPVVVPMLHGGLGEDGALREILDLIGVPYIGSRPGASRLTFNKSLCTPLIKSAGLRTPKQVVLPDGIFRELGAGVLTDALAKSIGFPMMVKPTKSGSALGASKVETAAELPGALVGAYAYGPVAVVEEFITGTEIAVTIVDLGEGPAALPAVEIRPQSGVYDYESRYNAGATSFVTPAELPDETLDAAAQLSLDAFAALGLSQFGRIDIIVDAEGPVFIEANVAPGMTDTSLAPLAFGAADLELGEVFSKLVEQCRG